MNGKTFDVDPLAIRLHRDLPDFSFSGDTSVLLVVAFNNAGGWLQIANVLMRSAAEMSS